MSDFKHVKQGVSGLSLPLKLTLAGIIASLSVLSLTLGVGAASLTETAIKFAYSEEAAPIYLTPERSVSRDTTVVVEIIRNGATICMGEGTPMPKNYYSNQYSVEKPIANCPPLKHGDSVRATWQKSSEITISTR